MNLPRSRAALWATLDGWGALQAAKNLTYLSVANQLCFAVELLASIYVARALAPAHFGMLSTVYAFVALFRQLPSLGTDLVIVRDVSRTPSLAGILLSNSLLLRAVTSFVSILLVNAFALILRVPGEVRFLIFVYSLSFALEPFFSLPCTLANARERFKLAALAILFTRVVSILAPPLAVLMGFGVRGVIVVSVLGTALTGIAFLPMFHALKIPLRYLPDLSLMRSLVIQGVPIAVSS
ncbi:MAG: oligosaccharide flippase family protein, partial [Candidatus Sumerlaeota bacterium]|nr:oligosaccharide flippase family protein [Candidatus Sumerlaeota bacterium]